MKVLRPSKNVQTGGYSASHKGYDMDAEPDVNYVSSFYGKVVQAKNSETRNWQAFKANDPYKDTRGGQLLTADYGNYIKIKGEVDGKTVYQLGAHFKTGTVLPVGTEVKKGQVVAQAGNTGNSTGSHSHTEYRDENNVNFPVEFTQEIDQPINEMEKLPKDSVIRDFYTATKPDFSEDEVKAWIQSNKNLREVFRSVLEGDGMVRKNLLNTWGIVIDTNKDQLISKYEEFIFAVKDELRKVDLQPGASESEILAKLQWVVEEYKKLKEEGIPETIYKYDGKDYQKVLKVGNVVIILEKG